MSSRNKSADQLRRAQRQMIMPHMATALKEISSFAMFQVLGERDRSYSRACVEYMRDNIDTVLGHYSLHGGRYLPAFKGDDPIGYQVAWMLLYSYILMTRGGFRVHTVGSGLQRLIDREKAVTAVSNSLLIYVNDHRQWVNSDEVLTDIMAMGDCAYRPSVKYDGEDILAVAHLLGFDTVPVINVDQHPAVLSDEVRDEADESIPPTVAALFNKTDQARLVRAYSINAIHLQMSVSEFVAMPCSEDKAIQAILGLLFATQAIPTADDPSLPDIVRLFLGHVRKATLVPVPLRRDDEMNTVFKRRLGFGVDPDQNDLRQTALFNSCSVLALSLSPEGLVKSLN